MEKLLTIAALLGLATTTASAQSRISFAPRLGLNVSTFSADYPVPLGITSDTKYLVGVQVGGTVNIALSDNFAFQPSLIFSQKGAEMLASTTDKSNPPYTTSVKLSAKPTFNFLELPLNAVYTFGGAEGFQIFAGPYLALGVGGSGTATIDIESDDPDVVFSNAVGSFPISLKVEYGSQQNDNAANNNPNNSTPSVTLTMRRFDAGLNAGVGYRKGPFQAQLGYGLGLINFMPNDPEGNDTGSTSYHRVFQLSANYFIGPK